MTFVRRIGRDVFDVYELFRTDHSIEAAASRQMNGGLSLSQFRVSRWHSMLSYSEKLVVSVKVQVPEFGPANANGIGQNTFKDRIQFTSRTADKTENLGGRRLVR